MTPSTAALVSSSSDTISDQFLFVYGDKSILNKVIELEHALLVGPDPDTRACIGLSDPDMYVNQKF